MRTPSHTPILNELGVSIPVLGLMLFDIDMVHSVKNYQTIILPSEKTYNKSEN